MAQSLLGFIFRYWGIIMKKWIVSGCLWYVLLLGCVQNVLALANDLAYLKDMPTVAEIKEHIKGENEAQTLGRQCAAFEKMEYFGFFPFINGQIAGQSWRDEYRKAADELGNQYKQNIKPLDNKKNLSEWARMCRNYLGGYDYHTGKPDNDYPALDKPVEDDELVALFKPSVMAVYQKDKAEREARDIAYQKTNQLNDRKKSEEMFFMSLPIVGFAILVLIFWLMRHVKYRLFDDGSKLEINGQIYQVHQKFAEVLDKNKTHKTTIGTTPGTTNVYPEVVIVSPPTITSRTDTHDALLIKDTEGKESTIRLKNWDIEAWVGNNVCFIWFSNNGKESDDYVAYFNLSTNEQAVNRGYLSELLTGATGFAWLLVLISALLTYGLGLIGILAIVNNKTQAKSEAEKVAAWLQKNVKTTN
jgi:hypothetical protein